MTAATRTRRVESRSNLVACAVLSAISLALPAGIYLLVATSTSARHGMPANVIAVAIAAAVAIAYAAIVLASRSSGAALIAGVSTTLCVLGVVALVPILLLAKLDSMSGGHTMGTVVFGALVYVAVQFGLSRAAQGVAGMGKSLRATGGFQLGAALPIICAFLLSAVARMPANAANDKAIADVRARQKTRGDLFALYACATAHRSLAPRHDYPASLQALGAAGDKCLPKAIATGEHGFRFEYTPRMSGADTVVGFTVRAIPKEVERNATMLTMDEHAIIEEDWVKAGYAAPYRQTPPGVDMLVAMRDCEKIYRRYHHAAPSDLRALRAFADSTLDRSFPTACWTYRNVQSSLEWADYGQTKKLNQWTGPAYTLTFHRESNSGPVTYEVRPKTWGVTGIWSYLEVSPGAMYGTTEPRAATSGDVAIPVCEFGALPAGSPQCAPGNSPPPNATLAVDSVANALDFPVALVDARDSTGAHGDSATKFQYAFSCDGLQNDHFGNDASYTCHAPWHADSVQVMARIRNRDLTVRDYTRWVHLERPPLAMRLTLAKSVVLGDTLELRPVAVGRDSSEQFELTVHIGDAFPMSLSNWANGAPVKCSATTRPLSWECSYPDSAGTYRMTVTAKSWKGDTASATGSIVVRRPK